MKNNRGIVYVAFGLSAWRECEKSIYSLRETGCALPVMVVGDGPVSGAEFHKWTGESPFASSNQKNFQFLAGRIKPRLYKIVPWKQVCYLDVDTLWTKDPDDAFWMLRYYDLLLTQHCRGENVDTLYNRPNAGWSHNISERDKTTLELGGNGSIPYWNSGVWYFNVCDITSRIFDEWYLQWTRFGQWDEQLALMRAVFMNPARICVLPEEWNHPHRGRSKDEILFHNYGRGIARSNVR